MTRFTEGVGAAILAAVLFGASTPLAKLLVGQIDPAALAGLCYLGSGVGLFSYRRLTGPSQEAGLTRPDLPWLAGAILAGGVFGPFLLMLGLSLCGAATASLLLNLEGVFTALLAWFVFRENFDNRVALGMLCIVAGGLLLSWQGGHFQPSSGIPAIVLACLCWAIDNNLTQKVSGQDPTQIAAWKGAVAGVVNLAVAVLARGASLPAWQACLAAMLVGFLGYGVSLALFVVSLRHIGTARTGAYFSLAPFVGAGLAMVLGSEPLSALFWAAAALMAVGVWLHLTERHEHEHTHEALEHCHFHYHDEHHQHHHDFPHDARLPHSHWHVHEPITHTHAHYPDIHHRHEH